MSNPRLRLRAFVVLLLAATTLDPGPAGAQPGPGCDRWAWTPLDQSSFQGANGTIFASTLWDPDGAAGPLGPRLVVGGAFDIIQGSYTGRVAQHNTTTGVWDPFSLADIGAVKSLGVFNEQLIIGGQNIYRWNGSGFEVMGAGLASGEVRAIAVHDGQLYIGGSFTLVGGGSYFARWSGSGWQTILGGPNDWVDCFAEWNGSLVLGGHFTQVGSPAFSVGHLARFDGTWNAMGTAMDNVVLALQPYGGFLYAGGSFTHANGNTSGGFARWNGSVWSPVGGNFLGIVYTLGVHSNQLVIGGQFPGINASPNLARYDGTSYSTYATGGANGIVFTVSSAESQLWIGGAFDLAGGIPAKFIARWNGSAWSSVGGGSAAQVRALLPFVGGFVVAGDFSASIDPNPTAFRIVTWNGQRLTNFGNGMNGLVLSLEGFRYSGPFGTNELIAGGYFTQAGTVAANRIARWNVDLLNPLPPPAWQAMGAGFNDAVYAIKRFNGVTYAAGTFTASGATPVSRIAKWNETTDAWEPVGTGMNGTVYALEVYNGALYAGGSFTSAGGVSTGGFARWNGSSWSNIGGFFLGTVYALELHNNMLAIGGQFTGFGGSPNLSSTNGASYANFGVGGADGPIYAIASHEGSLFIGGDFAFAGNQPARRLASFDGTTWREVDGGTDDAVYALASHMGELHVGGWFGTEGTLPLNSPRWARWSSTGIPAFSRHPSNVTVSPGATASFTAEIALGYSIDDVRWYRGIEPLVDGPTGTGSTISGATLSTLTISNVSQADAGVYARHVVNACGEGSSNPASLNLNVVGVGPDADAPVVTALERVAPNPTRGASLVSYALARPSRVALTVFDVSGRALRRVERGAESAGRHDWAWDGRAGDGRTARPGLYFVRLEADERAIGAKKLVLTP